MARFLERRSEKLGKPPGSVIYVGPEKNDPITIDVIEFNPTQTFFHESEQIENLHKFKVSSEISWINVNGVHDVETISRIGEVFGLHVLLMEDIANTGQRPKCDEFDEQLFLVLKILSIDEDKGVIVSNHVCLVVGENYLLSFHEGHDEIFDSVRNRLLRPTTKIRNRKSDYLAYALMDTIVENYISIIEKLGERIENLEDRLIQGESTGILEQIFGYKREISFLRKIIRPVRDLIIDYKNSESNLIEEQSLKYFRDLEDQVEHAFEAIELYQLMLKDQLELYQSIGNNRLNEILRVLTVFSVIFIPLTFLAGIYGTNFKYLPELEYELAYPIFWGVLMLIAGGMLLYFKRKRWL